MVVFHSLCCDARGFLTCPIEVFTKLDLCRNFNPVNVAVQCVYVIARVEKDAEGSGSGNAMISQVGLGRRLARVPVLRREMRLMRKRRRKLPYFC